MEPQEIAAVYETLAPMATDYANANLERAGQAQASIGPLAEAAMGGNRTAGIGNYTYNRLVRPAVDTLRDQLLVAGYSAALNKQLSDSLNAAKENYSRASRSRNGGGGSGGGGNPTGSTGEVKITDELIEGTVDAAGNKIPEQPNAKDYIQSGWEFSNYGSIPGQTGKFPLTVDGPLQSTSYYEYSKSSDPIQRGNDWVAYLYSIGYGG